LAVIAWAAVIFIFSAQPSLSSGLGTWDLILRKMAHMFVFGVLTFFIWRAILLHGVRSTLSLVLASIASLAYAVSDEYHQSFVFGRTASVYDVAFDLAGILVAVAIISYSKWHLRQ
jgi:VanZ family protein